ncbi:MAG: bifunctional (p)ppGpp synthetase/guanosine-3',5'-bis(diphosphate) 3'-pyrophosphohydrolase [Sporocytophaga sp.]|uniref:HD domain-containing protein n=1 Tax=Sporocytophaga sp. TaxID=2231183 RepID=UPI001B1696F5|nr:HD domain-containing protein [Sporocytophaga sp.]MBO9700077.1 bifunctional (p)ppGpp synthetase/guanosine-3',5'-bis(diphosphate) 3'-pyrophosphohydrolase [Sporocytophaga sp.]
MMNKKWSIDDIQNAWQLATKQHDGQKYGGPNQGEQIEYINHIGSVVFEIMTAITIEDEMDSNLAIKCAILHDTIEDTSLSYDDILTRFGSEVANGVLALTKNENITGKREKMLDSLRRIKEQPKEIWAIKMADRIANLYAPPFYWTNEKKKEYIEEARLIHDELQAGNNYLGTRLANKIIEYQKFID